jgi:mannose-6-phosphate isomerase-like protein (cupin superfamily)
MKPHDIKKAMTHPPQFEDPDGEASFWTMESFNEGQTWVGRFTGQSPWERHPDGDELLHVLEGKVEVTVLTEGGAVEQPVSAGSIFVIPRGLWHRQFARSTVLQFGATPGRTEHSTAEDPRQDETGQGR